MAWTWTRLIDVASYSKSLCLQDTGRQKVLSQYCRTYRSIHVYITECNSYVRCWKVWSFPLLYCISLKLTCHLEILSQYWIRYSSYSDSYKTVDRNEILCVPVKLHSPVYNSVTVIIRRLPVAFCSWTRTSQIVSVHLIWWSASSTWARCGLALQNVDLTQTKSGVYCSLIRTANTQVAHTGSQPQDEFWRNPAKCSGMCVLNFCTLSKSSQIEWNGIESDRIESNRIYSILRI